MPILKEKEKLSDRSELVETNGEKSRRNRQSHKPGKQVPADSCQESEPVNANNSSYKFMEIRYTWKQQQ